jgi:DNA-binding protein H-NS
MFGQDFDSMDVEQLWALHEEIADVLTQRIQAERALLEERLMKLEVSTRKAKEVRPPRRRYPPVTQKFRNPDNPDQTWSGRGKKPVWLREQLAAGRRMDEFKIQFERPAHSRSLR